MPILSINPEIVPDTAGSTRHFASQKMRPSLRSVFESWAGDRQRLQKCEIEVRYKWALDVQRLSENPPEYGETAVDLLFEAMGIDRQQISTYLNIAQFISDELIREIISFNSTPNSQYGTISWSHITELSRIRNHQVHQDLLTQCATERWSVTAMREAVSKRLEAEIGLASTEKRQPSPASIANRARRSATSFMKSIQNLQGECISEGLSRLRTSNREASLEALRAARQTLDQCPRLVATCLKEIDEAIAELEGPKPARPCTETPKQPTVSRQTKKVVKVVRRPLAPNTRPSSTGGTATPPRQRATEGSLPIHLSDAPRKKRIVKKVVKRTVPIAIAESRNEAAALST
jgi:hypothetical protein